GLSMHIEPSDEASDVIDHRADDPTKSRTDGESQPDPPVAGQDVGIDEPEPHRDGPRDHALDLFASLAHDDRPGDAPPIRYTGTHQRPSRWKRRLILGAFLAAHLTLFGIFYFFILAPSSVTRKAFTPGPQQDSPPAARNETPRPSAIAHLEGRDPSHPLVERKAIQPAQAPEPIVDDHIEVPDRAAPSADDQAIQTERAPETKSKKQAAPPRK